MVVVKKSFKLILFFIFSFIFSSYVLGQASVEPTQCYVDNDPETVVSKVLVINFDPNITINGQTRTLRSYMKEIDPAVWPTENGPTAKGWDNPADVMTYLESTLEELGRGKVDYQITDVITETTFESVPLTGGETLTQQRFLDCFAAKNNADQCFRQIDIAALQSTYDICNRANNGDFNEVWLYGPRYGIRDQSIRVNGEGGYESASIAPQEHTDLRIFNTVVRNDACNSVVPILFNNYNYTKFLSVNWESLHFLGHRFEYIMSDQFDNNISGYVRNENGYYVPIIDKVNRALGNFFHLAPTYTGYDYNMVTQYGYVKPHIDDQNKSGCGETHGDPLSINEYQHDRFGYTAMSNCYNPDDGFGYNHLGIDHIQKITDANVTTDCGFWGCTYMGWQRFWFKRIPANKGVSGYNLQNNWWKYLVKPELVKEKFTDQDACTCPTGYAYNSMSGMCEIPSCLTGNISCTGTTPICSTTGSCVECQTASDCPDSTDMCNNNICEICPGVLSGGICYSCSSVNVNTPVFNMETGLCEACPAGQSWDGTQCALQGCAQGLVTCNGATPVCDYQSSVCVECVTDSQCDIGLSCVNNQCSMCPAAYPNLEEVTIPNTAIVDDICFSCSSAINPLSEFCIASCPAGQTLQYDPLKGLEVCTPTTCGTTGQTCGGLTPWCTEGECKACPQGSYFDQNNNECLYCGDNEYFDGIECVEATCANGGVVCQADSEQPFCNSTSGECVECLANSDCVSNYCSHNVCMQCAQGEHYNPTNQTCNTCPSDQQWDGTTNTCVTKEVQSNGWYTCINIDPGKPVVSSDDTLECVECNVDADCQTSLSFARHGDKQYCDDHICSICPASLPNYNVFTEQCEPSCPEPEFQLWNGRSCVEEVIGGCNQDEPCSLCTNPSLPNYNFHTDTCDPICPTGKMWTGSRCITPEYDTSKYEHVCYYYDQSSVKTSATNVCTIDKPYCIRDTISIDHGIFDTQRLNYFDSDVTYDPNNFLNTQYQSGIICLECTENLDCNQDTPICISGACHACPADTPAYNSATQNCEPCPTTKPFFNKETNTCEVCPPESVWNDKMQTCESSNCLINPNLCPNDKPICLADGTCAECTSNAQCGSQAPICDNNLCTQCEYYDPVKQECYTPSPAVNIPNDVLVWDGTQYIEPTCENGTLLCNDPATPYCLGDTNSCVACADNSNCGTDAPICDLNTYTCISCPIDKPYYAPITGMDTSTNQEIPDQITLDYLESLGFVQTSDVHEIAYECTACPTNTFWDGVSCVQESCTTGAVDCSLQGLVCDINNGNCVECNDNNQCGVDAPYCSNGSCQLCPNDTPFYNSLTNECEPCTDGLTWYNGQCIAQDELSIQGSVLFTDSINSPIENNTIKLEGTDYFGSAVAITTLTDENGEFWFMDVKPGNYEITEIQQIQFSDGDDIPGTLGGDVTTNDVIARVELRGLSSLNNLFYEQGRSISGYVLYDLDNNQRKSDGDKGIENVELVLTGINDLGNNIEISTLSLLDGYYSFDNLRPGLYEIKEIQPTAYADGLDFPAENAVLVSNDHIGSLYLFDEDITGNIFLEGGYKISGHVFLDNERDKEYDGKEKLLDGITLELRDENNKPIAPDDLEIGGIFDPIVEVTDDGYYEFTNIPNGTYYVVQHQPDEYGSTTTNKVEVTVFNSNVENIDFGEKGGVIRGYLFGDENGNGKIDGDEDIFDNVKIIITGPQDYKDELKSKDNGQFRVRGLEKGKYKISIPEYGFEMTINLDAGEEDLNILIDLFPYLKDLLSNNLQETGFDLRLSILLATILLTSSVIVLKTD